MELDAEFLRRALGLGREGNPEDVEVTPDALPPDFPLTLPEFEGLRVLGGVRSAAPRWTFYSPGSEPEAPAEYVMWRAFLDVPAPQPEVMDALLAHFGDQGWRAAQIFQDVFVEATRTQWMAARLQPARQLDVLAQGEGGVTQVQLNVKDVDASSAEHLLGHRPHPPLREPL